MQFLIFIYFITGNFPSRDKLSSILAANWAIKDIGSHAISEATLGIITDQWREQFRPLLIQEIKDKAKASKKRLTRKLVGKLVKQLPKIWKNDQCNLVSLVMETAQ